MPETITEPGVYDGIANDAYHADPVPEGSLSCSGAKKLLPPNCPARFAYEREFGRPPKRAFDFGSAAHKAVLGAGDDLVIVHADSWRTAAAKDQRDTAYAEEKVPLLAHEWDVVEEMAAAIRAHPVAAALFDPERGAAEQSLFWIDDRAGIWRRARLDWLPTPIAEGGRLIVPDYKTCRSAAPEHIAKDVHNYGYHQQAAWYLDGIDELDLADDAAFVFVFQEKDPPYLVTVAELDNTAVRIGRHLNRQAIAIYRDCVESGHWPGYADGRVELLSLPTWAENRHLEEALL